MSSPQKSQFAQRLRQLSEFRVSHGHCNVSQTDAEYTSLGLWVKDQRKLKKQGRLPEDRIESLDALGFEWDRAAKWNEAWMQRLAELQAFREEFGHCNVSTQSPQYRRLGIWVANQRKQYKQGTLDHTRAEMLEKVGFQWELRRSLPRSPRRDWESMYQRLSEVHAEYGHCHVPHNWIEDPALGRWVQKQRHAMSQGKLTDPQILKLVKLDFEWNAAKAKWKMMFAAVLRFLDIHGHLDIPDDKLFNWIANQRRRLRKGELDAEQTRMLKKIGIRK